MACTDMHSQCNAECKSSLHNEHLCYIISQGFNLSDKKNYQSLIVNPKFKCEHCGRVAASDKNLCEPRKLELCASPERLDSVPSQLRTKQVEPVSRSR